LVVANPLVIRACMRIVKVTELQGDFKFYPDGLLRTNIWIYCFYDGGGLEGDQTVRVSYVRFDPSFNSNREAMRDLVIHRIDSQKGNIFRDNELVTTTLEFPTEILCQPKPTVFCWIDSGGRVRELNDSCEPHFLQNMARIETALCCEKARSKDSSMIGIARERIAHFINKKNQAMEKALGLAVTTPKYVR